MSTRPSGRSTRSWSGCSRTGIRWRPCGASTRGCAGSSSDFARLTQQLDPGSISVGRRLALRRVLFQLYALLKIHLAEEEAYLRVVDHGVSTDVADMLAAALDHPGFQSA